MYALLLAELGLMLLLLQQSMGDFQSLVLQLEAEEDVRVVGLGVVQRWARPPREATDAEPE